jgi:phosphoribosylaminoimidazole-succinocarboxamide synthase
MGTLLHSRIQSLPTPLEGKVREVYDLGDAFLIVATDRISAFDVVLENGIPDKGAVLNGMSAFWFDRLASICPSHMITIDDETIQSLLPERDSELRRRSMLVKKARPLPVECVARRYISGSLFKEYTSYGADVHELGLPEGLIESEQLREPIFTPATKAGEGHDENLSFRQAADLIGKESAEFVRDRTLSIFREASKHAADCGLILADTKFEFGETDDGLIWIDEALTPDSSRYWDASRYEPGHDQPSYDKQFVRDYLRSIGWDMRPPGPRLPEDVVHRTREKYLDCFRLITGRRLLEP